MPGPFPYLLSSTPPVPGCGVTMRYGNNSRPCWAIIDTGADYTCIPVRFVRELFLRKFSEIDVRGLGGEWEKRPMYRVNLEFLGFVFADQVVVSTDWDEVLIGRDILNNHELVLSGPNREFSID